MKEILSQFAGQSFVVKVGGEILLNRVGLDALARDVMLLAQSGIGVTVVHGGGPQADTLAARLGHTVRKVAGRRITDDDALEVAKMVYSGSTNIELLAALRRHGALAIGLSGVDAGLINARRRPPIQVKGSATGRLEIIDFGHVGDIVGTDTALLDLLLGSGYIAVVASLAADNDGNILNVNADTIAQALAVALHADRLVLITNVPGVMFDPHDPATLIDKCNVAQLRGLIERGSISGGMIPKAQNCIDAIEAGVKSVQILDGTGEGSLLLKSLTGEAPGTLITS